MKHIIILGDGMADNPHPVLGGHTLLQHAHTPYMDLLAARGRTGMLRTVPHGFHPGSEVANMAVLGYDLPTVYEGRGVLEAASMDVTLEPGDLALRCNLVCIEGDRLKNHSAGHIPTQEATELITFLQQNLGDARVKFYPGVQYRHLLVIKGGNKQVACTPPHDVPLQPYAPLLPKPTAAEGEETAALITRLIIQSQALLADHPLNRRRVSEGKDPANSIWPWSPGYRPRMEALSRRYPSIKRGGVISAVDLIRGIGRYAGLRNIPVAGITGLYDTNYEGKALAALEALRTDDFVYLHVEASDEAGHEGDVDLKLRTIENLDHRIVRPIYEAVSQWSEPVAIALLPDHPTPCEVRTHTADPVPFAIWYPGIEPDEVQTYDEFACRAGAYGTLDGAAFMPLFMSR